ncbi:MAG: hypothetical protein BGO31_11095 [Bacteroidetes bacterium 43-16]|uniref:thiopeptide-type bacteriocin biosynthesis protein n=1 Tax=uncultured Dysgonomonas sp. TaxID=206096 RepID=UPI00092C590D|nr:thiopeptide-type bacteriocin biosynthesis protein [uncultured Dysgonomonas sp.]OJV51005.1 MAG: hypothetical protein BGO31_11095 [Bacteroidetes bacterium 43-16]
MKIYSQLMIRVPQFPFNAKLEDVWDDLLRSIESASPEFYQKVSHLTPKTLYQEQTKIIHTLLKYFNRAKYRSTPFATFSAFGIAQISDNKISQVRIKNIRTIHSFTDWKYSSQVEYVFSDVLAKNLKLIANSTYYQVVDMIRYVRRKENNESFELVDVEATNEILLLLKSLPAPLEINELLKKLESQIERFQLLALIEAMILSNLIITEFDPNTLGQEYFSRIGTFNYNACYTITQLNFDKASISNEQFKHLPGLIDLLSKILPQETNTKHITEFISLYTKLFDRKHVRLMEALDPQLGVGYGNLYKEENSTEIIDSLLNQGQEEPVRKVSGFLEFLKTGLMFSKGDIIDLAMIPNRVYHKEMKNKLPNTFSVIGSIVDEHFHLERIGGHTANQLAGRFSLCGGDAYQYAKDLVSIEEQANPDIVFFDIAYHDELTVDNINRRPLLYEQEVNLICYPGVKEPLSLDDLYISISGDSIVLRSERLGKRVVPRMSSAYNYRRSQLPVFRFLYDLAFYGVWPDLSFDIVRLLPGLSYYPQIIYKNIIISLPKISVKRKDYKQYSDEEVAARIKQLLKEYNFGNLIKILKGEEPTVYDLENPYQMDLFISEVRRQDEITIEELHLPKDPMVKDGNNAAFVNQVIIPVYHNQELYPGSAVVIHDTLTKDRDYLPLQDWAYFDIFVHPLFADNILLGPITNLLNTYKTAIEKWFFIRYNEQGEHLRLRIKADEKCLSGITNFLNNEIKSYYSNGIVKDIRISTYQRELERYDVVGIDNVEKLFWQSSQLVLSILETGTDEINKFKHCFRTIEGVRQAGIISEKRFSEWTSFIRMTLEKEHQLQPLSFKTLNKYIKDHFKIPFGKPTRKEKEFIAMIVSLLEQCPKRRQAPFFTDLMHMHINRLFADHQRTYEMIFYNIYLQYQKRESKNVNVASHIAVSTE